MLAEKFPGTKSLKLSEYGEDGWAPPLYDIWKAAKNTNEVKHFGTTSELSVLCQRVPSGTGPGQPSHPPGPRLRL